MPFASSLSKETIETVLGLKESNIVFYPEFSSEILQHINKETLVSIGEELVKNIQNEQPILVSHLKEIGIDPDNFEIYMNIKATNI